MKRMTLRRLLMASALVIGIGSAAFGSSRAPSSSPAPSAAEPAAVAPFELARMLSIAAPDTLVLTLGKARHAIEGALPSEAYGASDDEFVARAPTSRRLILAGADRVRTDRVARRLMATGHDVRVLAGGIDAWDKAMDVDPTPPSPGATAQTWDTFRYQVALRRRFGVHDSAPAPAIAAPSLPASTMGASAPAKKREGC